MYKYLVIVESPAKAKTMERYFGSGYSVKATLGHIRDLPKNRMGVDIENGFEPEYSILPGRKDVVSQLQKAARGCDTVLLAADPDREGEAICWHLAEILKDSKVNVSRILFHEITKNAIRQALEQKLPLDEQKVDAQQTRRILDRLVGYSISPLLWKKVGRKLSAGRVQSIALRLICEREKEIRDFVPEEFWTITAHLKAQTPPPFKANLVKIDGRKAKIATGEQAESITADLKGADYILHGVKVRRKKRTPAPPFITSTLQQESFRANHFSVKKTMMVAQKLYEGMEIGTKGLVGLITYMRTDSVRISEDALSEARDYIQTAYSKAYLPEKPRAFKNKRKAQDAHEAIRPTSFDLPPEKVKAYLSADEFRLYSQIWNRFIASQMSAAQVEETEFDIRALKHQFKAKGEVIKFDGHLVLTPKKSDSPTLPTVETGERLELSQLESKQSFTQPPSRYSEGTLVKELEAKGIGRPSTYAPIIATIQGRDYVIKEKGRFIPTEVGIYVTDYLIQKFPDLMKFEFTARLEEQLDLISEGKKSRLEYLQSYYDMLQKDMEKAEQGEGVKKQGIPSEEICPECGKGLVIKEGRYGRFKACSGYPECTYKKSFDKKEPVVLEEKCPQCGAPLVQRQGRYGAFVACSDYPRCKYIKSEKKDTGIACPLKCGGTIVRKKTRKGKIFYGCSRYPGCKFATWDEPVPQPCPVCGREFVLRKNAVKGTSYLYCSDKECSFKQDVEPEKE